MSPANIHPSAIVHPAANLGSDVEVGPYSIIHPNVRIGDGSTIGSHCEIGHPTPRAEGRALRIGPSAVIRSHSIFYEGSHFGERLVTGHRVTVREGTQAGANLQIGTLSDIQGDCTLGDYVRLHSNVFVGQHATIGCFVWLFPHVVLTNDPHPPSELRAGVTIDEFAVVAVMSVILPGVRVGRGALVGANSSVNRDVAPDTVVAGSPAKHICETTHLLLRDGSDQPAYPWRRHFHRGYPDDAVATWIAEFAEVEGVR